MLLLLFAVGCAEPTPPKTEAGHHIAYRLFVNDVAALDSTGKSPDAIAAGLAEIASRIQDHSIIHAAWSDWPSAALQQAYIDPLLDADSAIMHIVLDQMRYAATPDSALQAQPLRATNLSEHVKFANRLDSFSPEAAVLHRNRLNCNFILYRNLQPDALDDGAFGILFMGGPWAGNDGRFPITEALWIAGDSSLYARFLDYWQMIAADESSLLSAQSHTYSNLHDHLVWSFPDLEAEQAATDMLLHFDTGLQQTRQPAKLRLVLSELDEGHVPFVEQLVALQARHEIDLRVVLPVQPYSSIGILQAVKTLPAGQARYFWQDDDSAHTRFAANFMLIDGPYPLKEDALAEPRRLSFFFGDGWNLPALRQDWGLWLRILDRSTTERLEDHFDQIWEMSSDTLQSRLEIGIPNG